MNFNTTTQPLANQTLKVSKTFRVFNDATIRKNLEGIGYEF